MAQFGLDILTPACQFHSDSCHVLPRPQAAAPLLVLLELYRWIVIRITENLDQNQQLLPAQDNFVKDDSLNSNICLELYQKISPDLVWAATKGFRLLELGLENRLIWVGKESTFFLYSRNMTLTLPLTTK